MSQDNSPQDAYLSELVRKQSLKKPLRFVTGIYIVFFIIAAIGFPQFAKKKPPFDLTQAVSVDLVAATGDISAAPNKVRQEKPIVPNSKPKPQDTKPPAANPEKPPSAVKSDAAKKADVPKPKEKPVPPKPKPAPKAEAPKKDATKPAAKPKEVKLEKPKKQTPQKSKDDGAKSAEEQKEFNSLLKNLLGDVDAKADTPDGNPHPATVDPNTKVEGVAPTTSDTLALSEMDALKYQLAKCWNIPTGAMDAENLVVDLYLEMNPDRTVRSAEIMDTGRYSRDTFFQAAADSARRAVFHPHCNPLALPADKYDIWKTIVIRFNPREMF